MQTHPIESKNYSTPSLAVIDAIRQSIDKFSANAQALHIIIANVIYTDKSWKALVSVVHVRDQDSVYQKAIIFGHLPAKYADLYDDLLFEVDHLNLIDDTSIWQNIKNYLLDIYFYQACHYEKIERIEETGGGYFKEKKEKSKIDSNLDLLGKDPTTTTAREAKTLKEHVTFEKTIRDTEIKILNDVKKKKVLDAWEHKKAKNLTFALNRN